MNSLIAVPSDAPGGLDASLSEHFGDCAAFTLVQVRDGNVVDVKTLPATAHAEGGCLAVVRLLAEQGGHAVVAGGLGGRPLAGLLHAGIAAYRGNPADSVRSSIEAFATGRLPRFGAEFACGTDHAGHEGAAACA